MPHKLFEIVRLHQNLGLQAKQLAVFFQYLINMSKTELFCLVGCRLPAPMQSFALCSSSSSSSSSNLFLFASKRTIENKIEQRLQIVRRQLNNKRYDKGKKLCMVIAPV